MERKGNRLVHASLVTRSRMWGTLLMLTIPYGRAFAQPTVVAYYPSWLRGTLPASRIQFQNVTHIVHAFAWPESNGKIGRYTDLTYPELIAATHGAGKKILIALGGWGQSSGFTSMAADPAARAAFIQNLIRFCDDNGYDGVDVDWEYPSSAADRSNLNCLIKELREAFSALGKGWALSMAVPSGSWAGQWFDYDSLKQHVDWFGCMTYDFMGSWVPIATHNSPLYPRSPHTTGSVHEGIEYLHSTRSVPKNKILLGIPFYGRGCNATGLFHTNTGGNTEHYYSDIQPRIGRDWNYFWDDTCKVPYLLNSSGTKFISFDDTVSVRLKCTYAKERALAGVMIWALGQDVIATQQPLLETVGRVMGLTAVARPRPKEPTSFLQLSSYPNPVNGVATVPLYSPKQEELTLELFDARGREVASIRNCKPAGWYLLRLELKDLPSGIYVYSVCGAGFAGTGKLTIAK